MRLLSFVAGGEELFGVRRDDGIVLVNARIGQPTLRDALAVGAIDEMRRRA